MSGEQNKAIVRQFFKAFELNDQSALLALLAPNLVAFLPQESGPMGRQEFLELVRNWSTAFSNLHFTIESQIAEGDTVATHTTLEGIHSRGDFIGLSASGRKIAISVITIERVTGEQIVERRVVFDVLELMQQLGASPT